MKVKLFDLIDSNEDFNKLTSMDMKVVTAFKLSRIQKEVSDAVMSFYQSRNEFITRLGEENENGDYQVTDENLSTFNEQIDELVEQEIEISFDQISIEELKTSNGNDLDISASMLMKLSWLVVE